MKLHNQLAVAPTIIALLAQEIGEHDFEPSAETKLDELGMDSLDYLSFIEIVEDEFSIVILTSEMAGLKTLGDLIALVESK